MRCLPVTGADADADVHHARWMAQPAMPAASITCSDADVDAADRHASLVGNFGPQRVDLREVLAAAQAQHTVQHAERNAPTE